MLNGVNDVLTPWTPSRILRIMEAATASLASSRGGGDRTWTSDGSSADDSAMAMESLLHLSNQQPDVAGRVMAAPLFAQRPLVESAPKTTSAAVSFSSSLFYADAHRMCTHALHLCRPLWKDTEIARKGEERDRDHARDPAAPFPSSSPLSLPPSTVRTSTIASPYMVATELEEVAFAAEFAEPCLRGAFPNVAAVARHSLPAGCTSLLDGTLGDDGTATDRQRTKEDKLAQGVLRSLLQEPVVPHNPPSKNDGVKETAAPSSPHRLLLTQPAPAPAASSSALLLSSMPLPSAVPVEAYGPPGHKIFDKTSVVHTFTEAEVADLHAYVCIKPLPFQVYSRAEVQARRQQASHYQRRNAMLSAGAGATPIVDPHNNKNAGVPTIFATARHRSGKHEARVADDEHDGWSTSSGWSSSQSSSAPRSDIETEESSGKQQTPPGTSTRMADSTGVSVLTAEKMEDRRELLTVDEAAAVPRPPPNHTWVDDDGELIMVNGKVMVRKRRVRVPKNPPPPLQMPTMVSGPALRLPKQSVLSADATAMTVMEDEPGELKTPSQKLAEHVAAEDAVKEINDMKEETNQRAEEQALPTRRRCSGAKRGRAVDNESDQSASPTTGRPRKRATHANAKKTTGKRNAFAEERSSSATTLNTAKVPRLSESEMLSFVHRLAISDVLRHALLIGVQGSSVSEKTRKDDQADKDSTASV